MITSAKFGRMKVGKCVPLDLGMYHCLLPLIDHIFDHVNACAYLKRLFEKRIV